MTINSSNTSVTQFLTRRLAAFAGLIGLFGASLSGCGTTSAQPLTYPPFAGRAGCVANTPHNDGRARWTVLVYMQAGNNLQPESLTNIAQMASIGSDSNVNIVVQWKQIPASITNQCPNCVPSFYGVRRYLIKKHSASDVTAILNGNTTVLQTDRLPDPPGNTALPTSYSPTPKDTLTDPNGTANGTEDMGSYKSLQDFVQWGTTNYKADNVAIVIWDHGSGWKNVYRAAKAPGGASTLSVSTPPSTSHVSRAVGQDDEYIDEIETWELPAGLSNPAQPLDMLIFDCSLEQMIEVAYQVRNSARIMVGSEESPPGPGYPYDLWLQGLKTNGKTACDVGDTIIKTTVTDPNYTNDAQYSTELTQSMLDLSQMNSVAASLNSFAASLVTHSVDQATVIANVRNQVQHYSAGYSDNKDLYSYVGLIRTGSNRSDLQTAASNLQNTLIGGNGVILESMHGKIDQTSSYGLAVYVPTAANYNSNYAKLAISTAAPNWPLFLQSQKQ